MRDFLFVMSYTCVIVFSGLIFFSIVLQERFPKLCENIGFDQRKFEDFLLNLFLWFWWIVLASVTPVLYLIEVCLILSKTVYNFKTKMFLQEEVFRLENN